MGESKLGTLESVSLTTYWSNEDAFTKWLAENISLLSDELGLGDLEVVGTFIKVGSFEADVVCKNDQDNFVVIENQFKRTDHGHLGQVLTYAGGLPASAVIWIAERFHPQHRAALDWLNGRTNEGTDFYGIEVELLRIGQSLPAPCFTVVAKPNEFSKVTRTGVVTAISPEKQLELDFWNGLRDYLNQKSDIIREKGKINPRQPDPLRKNYTIVRLGQELEYFPIAVRWDPSELRVLVHLEGEHKVDYFDELHRDRGEIEQEIRRYCEGVEPLDWRRPAGPHEKAGRISVCRSADINDKNKWPEYYEWLRPRLEAFYEVFQPRLKAISEQIGQQEPVELDESADSPPTGTA